MQYADFVDELAAVALKSCGVKLKPPVTFVDVRVCLRSGSVVATVTVLLQLLSPPVLVLSHHLLSLVLLTGLRAGE